MNSWSKGFRLRKGWGYALVISDDGQHHWVPGRHVKERKEEGVIRHRSSWRILWGGWEDWRSAPPGIGSKDQWSQTIHLGSTEEVDCWRGKTGQKIGTALTSATLCLAMLPMITTTVGASHTYWAYLPGPPLLRPITWEDSSVPVFIKDSSRLPRPLNLSLPLKPE